MVEGKKVTLPSGAELEIRLAPFADSKALYQAVLEEVKTMNLDPKADVDVNLFKDLFCIGFSSKKIESALNKCFQQVTYNGMKISGDTWEPVSARDDYFKACIEVAKENILPFVKSLYAEYLPIFQEMVGSLTLRPQTTQS